MEERDRLMKQAKAHAKLAFIYADDGAFATAAKLLHETAVLFDKENDRRYRLMNPGPKKEEKGK